MAIGIDCYQSWRQLHNAVSDARGTARAFEQLGFEQVRAPLLDQAATRDALQRLVTDDLRTLDPNDSLVVFFAGHGHTVTTSFPDETFVKTGYLIPVGAERNSSATWLKLDSWLSDVARLPPRHILVILDACHSGIALAPVVRYRGGDVTLTSSMETLRARRSRRVITSALDDQLALDSGPLHGHSLFTGCLIQALTGGLPTEHRGFVTGSDIGLHVRRRVTEYPNSKQTPDFGALELDNRGELVVELPGEAPPGPLPPPGAPVKPLPNRPGPKPDITPDLIDTIPPSIALPISENRQWGSDDIRATHSPIPPATAGSPAPVATDMHTRQSSVTTAALRLKRIAAREPAIAVRCRSTDMPPSARPSMPRGRPDAAMSAGSVSRGRPAPHHLRSRLDPAFVAMLDRHDPERTPGGPVVYVVSAEPATALTGWATWAASRGDLTLITEGTGIDAAIGDLLARMPWLRLLSEARARFAAAAELDVTAVDAALDARSTSEREAWIHAVGSGDPAAGVSGWLLSALREPSASFLDPATAPLQGGTLLSILCELAAPIAVLVHHASPTPSWFERAIATATELTAYMPTRAVAVAAPGDLVANVIANDESLRRLSPRARVVPLSRPPRFSDDMLDRAKGLLLGALASDRRTAGLFRRDVRVPVHDHQHPVTVDLMASDAVLAVELDDWYRFNDSQHYHRDRIKDVWLQRAGFYVMRFLADEIEKRLGLILDEIAIGLDGRRASGSFPGELQ